MQNHLNKLLLLLLCSCEPSGWECAHQECQPTVTIQMMTFDGKTWTPMPITTMTCQCVRWVCNLDAGPCK